MGNCRSVDDPGYSLQSVNFQEPTSCLHLPQRRELILHYKGQSPRTLQYQEMDRSEQYDYLDTIAADLYILRNHRLLFVAKSENCQTAKFMDAIQTTISTLALGENCIFKFNRPSLTYNNFVYSLKCLTNPHSSQMVALHRLAQFMQSEALPWLETDVTSLLQQMDAKLRCRNKLKIYNSSFVLITVQGQIELIGETRQTVDPSSRAQAEQFRRLGRYVRQCCGDFPAIRQFEAGVFESKGQSLSLHVSDYIEAYYCHKEPQPSELVEFHSKIQNYRGVRQNLELELETKAADSVHIYEQLIANEAHLGDKIIQYQRRFQQICLLKAQSLTTKQCLREALVTLEKISRFSVEACIRAVRLNILLCNSSAAEGSWKSAYRMSKVPRVLSMGIVLYASVLDYSKAEAILKEARKFGDEQMCQLLESKVALTRILKLGSEQQLQKGYASLCTIERNLTDKQLLRDFFELAGDFLFYQRRYNDAQIRYNSALTIESSFDRPDSERKADLIASVANCKFLRKNSACISTYEQALQMGSPDRVDFRNSIQANCYLFRGETAGLREILGSVPVSKQKDVNYSFIAAQLKQLT